MECNCAIPPANDVFDGGAFVETTAFIRVEDGTRIATDEITRAVMCVLALDGGEMTRRSNDTELGRATGFFTRNAVSTLRLPAAPAAINHVNRIMRVYAGTQPMDCSH